MALAKEQNDMPTAMKKGVTSQKEIYIAFTHTLQIPSTERDLILSGLDGNQSSRSLQVGRIVAEELIQVELIEKENGAKLSKWRLKDING